MKSVLSPKQVASALGVSESSLKRWCDKGLLLTVRTAGGHRRLMADAVVQFVRQSGQRLIRPEVLGLPSNTGQGPLVVERGREQLVAALVEGDAERCRRIVFDLYLSGQSVVRIGDDVIAEAMHELGNRWHGGELEVYQERRGCEMVVRALHELRAVLPPVPDTAPLAIGGTLEGDPYQIATLLVELTLREAGWRADSYGAMLPVGTWIEALRRERPALCWISASYSSSDAELRDRLAELSEAAARLGIALLVGGRSVRAEWVQPLRGATFCPDLRHVASFAAGANWAARAAAPGA